MLQPDVIESFKRKLRRIDVASLKLSEYPAYYARHIGNHLDYYVSIYLQVIELAVNAAKKDVASLTVLDFGCGNGFLGLLAKQLGFKQVWLCDVSPDFLQAAERTAQAAAIELDGFIHGDISVVLTYFQSENVVPDIVLSTDVIEHIYDLENLFQSLQALNPSLISVFTTASNPNNFRKVKSLHKEQYKDEWIGHGDLTDNNRAEKGFSALSFYEQRKLIISNEFGQLPTEMVSELARLTRGKAVNDILESVRTYLNSGILPHPPTDVHWVCDPNTGSWTERILPLKTYRGLANRSGFHLHWVNGFYNASGRGALSSLIVRQLNWLLKNSRGVGKFFAPYIVLLLEPATENTVVGRQRTISA